LPVPSLRSSITTTSPDFKRSLSALRKAALADDSGQALDQALQQLAPA
jgi:hypothetical protein